MKKIVIAVNLLLLACAACNNGDSKWDASGTFEAEETIISAEAGGVIKQLDLEEGQTLSVGQKIGYIDSLQLYLKKKQLQAQMDAVLSKKPNIAVQLSSLQEQLKTAEIEQKRISNLLKANAATGKQFDDIHASIELLKKQIEAQKSSLEISTSAISSESLPIKIQIEQTNDQLNKCQIINRSAGTVLSKYAELNEMTAQGKPLYKIADLSELILRAYITGDQFSAVHIHQKVQVHTDDGKGGYQVHEGLVTWINDKAEFTPKTIQTKDERANLVYAIKVKVKNDGSLKMGMYGELAFQ